MTREIKYQGWNGKQIFQVVRIHLDADEAIWWSPDYDQHRLFNAEHNPLRQYTGLHDKAGKEIYEEDIIKLRTEDYYSNECVTLPEDYEGVAIVKFDLSLLAWYLKIDTSFVPLGDTEDMELEVIGNAYENPELLKGDKDAANNAEK